MRCTRVSCVRAGSCRSCSCRRCSSGTRAPSGPLPGRAPRGRRRTHRSASGSGARLVEIGACRPLAPSGDPGGSPAGGAIALAGALVELTGEATPAEVATDAIGVYVALGGAVDIEEVAATWNAALAGDPHRGA